MLSMLTKMVTGVDASEEEVPETTLTHRLSSEAPPFVPAEVEYVEQSASTDAEVDAEINECLLAIAADMNYADATKTMLITISLNEQRKSLPRRSHPRRTQKERSRSLSPCSKDSTGGETDSSGEYDSSMFNDMDADGWSETERHAVKSFGSVKVANFHRTKGRRDAAREAYLAEVASRANRHPSQRNVASRAHYASDARNRHSRFEERGGKRAGHSTLIALSQNAVAVQ